MRRSNLDSRIAELVGRIDAEKVTVSLTYDRNTFWQRRGRERARLHYEAEIEWEDNGEKIRIDGDVIGGSFARVFDAIEAQINGHLLRERMP